MRGGHDDEVELGDALQQFFEVQREIDEKAHSTVMSVRRMLDYRESLRSGFSKAFAARHGAWYDEIERALAAEGFAPLGAYEDADG